MTANVSKKSGLNHRFSHKLDFLSAGHAQTLWLIGQSVPLSESNAAFGIDIRDGAFAYFKSVNAKGGVDGRQIELVSLDDNNDGKLAGANAQKLLQENKVAALFGFASATVSLEPMPLAEKADVLFSPHFHVPIQCVNPALWCLRCVYRMQKCWKNVGFLDGRRPQASCGDSL